LYNKEEEIIIGVNEKGEIVIRKKNKRKEKLKETESLKLYGDKKNENRCYAT